METKAARQKYKSSLKCYAAIDKHKLVLDLNEEEIPPQIVWQS